MTTIIKAAGAEDFLTAVPAMLGYQPSESVVIIPFAGTRTVGAMRFDLADDEHAAEVARTVVGMACKVATADALAVIVYGERGQTAAIAPEIVAQARVCGLGVVDALYVTSEGWGRPGEAPQPLAPAPEHLTVAEGDQRAGAGLPEVAPERAEAVAAITPDVDAALDGGDLLDLIESALTWDAESLDAHTVAVAVALLNRPAIRDIALVQWAHGIAVGEAALDAQIGWDAGAEYPTHLAKVMWGEGPRPTPERLTAALDVVRHLAALATEAGKPGPLATAAWLSWALGRSTHAEVYAQHALSIDPQHGLAEIVQTFVVAGHLAEWCFTR
ncbi:DUF4192 family protein [Microbacterium maritypicum]|uniref:DUF4192 family protein n=1 Tax=Microbacterium maritypicum TaxID=33918 RepID=UPI003A947051